MKETRNFRIRDKVFTLNLIQKIASKFESEHKKTREKNSHQTLTFEVTCLDGSIYESEDSKIFDDQSVINDKKVQSLKFWFKNYYKNERSIILNLENGNNTYSNSLVISGEDSVWVNGTLRIFQEILNGAQPQDKLFRTFKLWFTILSSISIGIIFTSILAIAVRAVASKPFLNPFKLMLEEPIIVLFSTSIGLFPAWGLTDFFERLWPKVELQIGPKHTFLEANRRKLLFGIFTVLVLPIILTILPLFFIF